MGNSFYKSTVSVFALISSLTLLNPVHAMDEEDNPLENPQVKRALTPEHIDQSLIPFTPAELSHATFGIPEQTEQGFGSLPLLIYPIIYSFLSSPEDHKNIRGVSKIWRHENLSYVTSIISNWSPKEGMEPFVSFICLGGEEFIGVQKHLATIFFDFNPFDENKNKDRSALSAIIDTFHYYVDKFPSLLHLVSRFHLNLHPVNDWKLICLGKVAVKSIPTLQANLAQIEEHTRFEAKDFKKLAIAPENHPRLEANLMAMMLLGSERPEHVDLGNKIEQFLNTTYKKLYQKKLLNAPLWGYYCIPLSDTQHSLLEEATDLSLEFIDAHFHFFALYSNIVRPEREAFESLLSHLVNYYTHVIENMEPFYEKLAQYEKVIPPSFAPMLAETYDDWCQEERALEVLDRFPFSEYDTDSRLLKAELLLSIPHLSRLDEVEKLLSEVRAITTQENPGDLPDASDEEESDSSTEHTISHSSETDTESEDEGSESDGGTYSDDSETTETTLDEDEFDIGQAKYLESLLHIYRGQFNEALQLIKEDPSWIDLNLLTALQHQLGAPHIPSDLFCFAVEGCVWLFNSEKAEEFIKTHLVVRKTFTTRLKKYDRIHSYLLENGFVSKETIEYLQRLASRE